ncbi:hypothetical protein BKA81DRAFT_96861 [Phyllosticta paracitricarpa]
MAAHTWTDQEPQVSRSAVCACEAFPKPRTCIQMRVEVLETLVDMAEEVMERVERSTGALLARDVQGKMARREESQRRFGMADSFGSMVVSLDDLDLVRSTARSVVGMAEQMGEELERVALAAVDAVGATKDLMLTKELRSLSEAG